MFKNFKKIIKPSQYIFCIIFLLLVSFNLVIAQDKKPLTGKDVADGLRKTQFGLNPLATAIGFQTGVNITVAQMTGQIIGVVLSLLGIIFLILIIYGGFIWMTARGDDQKVTSAKDIIINAAIGAIIVFSAYAISSYIIEILSKATQVG
ncbi:MAG: hypothetical protein V1688_00175 [bacterium]